MHVSPEKPPRKLGLRAGDWVRIRPVEQILPTLDAEGRLDGLPFMPEMAAYCGQTLQVSKRVDKACDTIGKAGARRMNDSVLLDGLRCLGTHHGGCQALCTIFWKEAWLERAAPAPVAHVPVSALGPGGDATVEPPEILLRATRQDEGAGGDQPVYSCQATRLPEATTPMHWWHPGQYLRDYLSGNVTLGVMIRGSFLAWLNILQRFRGGGTFPRLPKGEAGKTPRVRLDLKPGEWVRVRSREEIVATFDDNRRNRGLKFDVEMLRYCGGTYRVLRRVETIIDEPTGKMIRLPNDCIILEGVVCVGDLSRNRLFCPRAIYPYWREIWLERVEKPPETP